MYCKYCGNSLPEDSRFCPSCGSNVQETPKETEAPSPNKDTFFSRPSCESASAECEKQTKKLHTFGLVGFILSCSSFVLFFFDLGIISTAGFIVSLIALIEFNKAPNKYKLKGFCIAGVAIGAVGVAIFIYIISLVGLISCAIFTSLTL